MSGKAFNKVKRGLEDAQAYMKGARVDYKVTVSPAVDEKVPANLYDTSSFSVEDGAATFVILSVAKDPRVASSPRLHEPFRAKDTELDCEQKR